MDSRTEWKVGIVGAGHISTVHLEAWARAPGCRTATIFDLDRQLAENRAARHDVPKVAPDLDRLIAECDIVDVCTPPQAHFDIAGKVIDSNRHLVIEKPIVTELSDWEILKQQLATSKSKIAVIHNLKFSHGVQQAKQWVDEGRIGKILRLTRRFLTHPESDRMLAGGPHWSHSLPGGRWFETLPHELYLVHYFLGEMELAHVSALRTPTAPHGVSADEVEVILEGDDCLASLRFSANCHLNRRGLTLEGTEGVIEIDILSDAAFLSTRRDRKWARAVGGQFLDSATNIIRTAPDRLRYLTGRLRGSTPHSRVIHGFVAHLQGAAPSPTPLDEIDYVVRYCDLIGTEIDRQAARSDRGSS